MVFQALEALAKRLDVTMDILWQVLVRQSYVEGAQYMIVAIAMLIGINTLNRYKRRCGDKRIELDEETIPASALATAAQVILSIPITLLMVHAVARFINPQFYAITKIMDVLKDKF